LAACGPSWEIGSQHHRRNSPLSDHCFQAIERAGCVEIEGTGGWRNRRKPLTQARNQWGSPRRDRNVPRATVPPPRSKRPAQRHLISDRDLERAGMLCESLQHKMTMEACRTRMGGQETRTPKTPPAAPRPTESASPDKAFGWRCQLVSTTRRNTCIPPFGYHGLKRRAEPVEFKSSRGMTGGREERGPDSGKLVG
jgi:hypothetical protein